MLNLIRNRGKRVIKPYSVQFPKAGEYLEPCEVSKIEHFTKIFNGQKPLTIFAKRSTLQPVILILKIQ